MMRTAIRNAVDSAASAQTTSTGEPVLASKARFTTVSTKGQVVIPAEIRHALGIEPGTHLLMRVENGRVVMVPEKRLTWRDMRGITAGGPSGTEMLLEDRRLERERELREEGW
jgi:antitoxin PrlF